MARGRVEPDTTPSPVNDEWDSNDPWGDESTPIGQNSTPSGYDQGFGDEYVADEFQDPAYDGFDDDPATTVAVPLVTASPVQVHEPWDPRAENEYRVSTHDEAPNYDDPDTYPRNAEPYAGTPDPGFDSDAFLRTPQKPTRTRAGKRRRAGTITAVAGVVALGVVAVGTIMGGSGDPESSMTAVGTTAAVTTTAPATPSTVASAPAPGDTTSGPGVILGFDDAYYEQRNGAAAAGYLVASQNTPTTAQAIQTDIDRLDPLTTHNIVVTSTDTENVYNVRLTVTTPDSVSHEYHQQYTVVSAGGRFYIANKLNCDSVCPTP
ncbi:hypothetical protein SIM91_04810 [Rhodococcus opacus]|uniref:hypothetical protein n=1 Tax=Rhodococcus opacus TaxID=37919 RepID=UPI0002A453CA|nr:hypothetical protein [Rhodococcus opacus]ELB88916.1 hypothetical protein Rwratislav_32170 [Rhodococcus wratislaviensis IFP 2016]MDX5962643.1 hypothetical protein [Rhodococcus opacus]CAG7636022.1 hypothetical protein E143388_07747 [Rhodococcus opacus]